MAMILDDPCHDFIAGKMVLLDKLLPKLKERDSRVLIFSQVDLFSRFIFFLTCMNAL